MGWKTFFYKTFKEEYDQAKTWGDLIPYKLIVGTTEYYVVGYVGAPAGFKLSPKIQHPQGVKTRITVKYFFWVQQNATGSADIYIVFYKNGETSKDPSGADAHGARHTLSTPPTGNFAEQHSIVFEYDGYNTLTWSVDGKNLGNTTLEVPLTSFKLAITTSQASGGDVGILIYEVSGEYYDVWEDLINQMHSMMRWMIPIMFILMFVPLIISIFRGGKEEKEKKEGGK